MTRYRIEALNLETDILALDASRTPLETQIAVAASIEATDMVDECVTLAKLAPTTLENTLTAHAGGTQAAALALSASYTAHHVTVCATAADSVLLPVLAIGRGHYVFNSGVASLQVFGAGTSTIDDVATATGVPLPPGTGAWFFGLATGKWYTVGKPIRTADAAQAVVETAAAINTVPFGYTEAQANGLVATVNALRTALINAGIIKGAA